MKPVTQMAFIPVHLFSINNYVKAIEGVWEGTNRGMERRLDD